MEVVAFARLGMAAVVVELIANDSVRLLGVAGAAIENRGSIACVHLSRS